MNGTTDRNQTDTFHQMRVVFVFVEGFLRIFSTTLVVFLRSHFGERYLDSILVTLAFILVMLATSSASFIAKGVGFEAPDGVSTRPLVLYAFTFLGLCIYHNLAAIRRRRAGEIWHSQSPGISHLSRILPFRIGFIHRFIEPALGAVLGIVIGIRMNAPLGAFIIIGAFMLFLVETLRARYAKNTLLDLIDQQIEARNRAAALLDLKPMQQTQGYIVTGAEAMSPAARRDLAAAFSGLEPEAQAIVGNRPRAVAT